MYAQWWNKEIPAHAIVSINYLYMGNLLVGQIKDLKIIGSLKKKNNNNVTNFRNV